MFEQVAAEQRPRAKRPEAEHVVVIGQIGLNIDPRQFAPIDMDYLDAAGSQRPEQLLLDPRLHDLADIGRAAAEVARRGYRCLSPGRPPPPSEGPPLAAARLC